MSSRNCTPRPRRRQRRPTRRNRRRKRRAASLLPVRLPRSLNGLTRFPGRGLTHVSSPARLKKRWKETPTKWSPIPVSLGAAVLVVLTLYKQASDKGKEPMGEGSVHVQGPWQVRTATVLCVERTGS